MTKSVHFLCFIALAFVTASSSSALATILFVGGEDLDFTMNGGGVSFTTGTYISGYSRGSISVYPSGGGGFAISPTFAANNSLWIHTTAAFAQSNGVTDVLKVMSPDGVARIVMRSTGTQGQFKLSTRTAANVTTDLVSMTSPCFSGAFTALDLFINYGGSGEVTLYCKGVAVADFVGNVATDSATQLNQIALGSDTGPNWSSTYWSEILVATTDTRRMRVVTLTPAANGNTTTFDTGGVTNINEGVINDSTVNASATAGQIQEYTVNALPSGLFNVLDVWLTLRASVDTTGPLHIQGMVRTGSTDFLSGILTPPTTTFGPVTADWPLNPNTGVAWTTGNLTSASGFNIGFKSGN